MKGWANTAAWDPEAAKVADCFMDHYAAIGEWTCHNEEILRPAFFASYWMKRAALHLDIETPSFSESGYFRIILLWTFRLKLGAAWTELTISSAKNARHEWTADQEYLQAWKESRRSFEERLSDSPVPRTEMSHSRRIRPRTGIRYLVISWIWNNVYKSNTTSSSYNAEITHNFWKSRKVG